MSKEELYKNVLMNFKCCNMGDICSFSVALRNSNDSRK